MLFPLWGLEEGPEWEGSVRAADPGDGYFQDNVQALKDLLQHDPHAYSHGYLEERGDLRVAMTRDVAAGYRAILFFKIEKRVVTLLWIELEPLADPE